MRRILITSSAVIILAGAMTSIAGAQSTPAVTVAPTAIATVAATAAAATASTVVALPNYQVTLFASSTSAYTNPDSLTVADGNVFIDYQNVTAKDCTDTKTSTVVEYTMDGKVVKTFAVPGHSDGMRLDPTTHLLWVTSCEDGNPKFVTIDPKAAR